MNQINYVQVADQTIGEKRRMYKKCKKKELIEFLIGANQILDRIAQPKWEPPEDNYSVKYVVAQEMLEDVQEELEHLKDWVQDALEDIHTCVHTTKGRSEVRKVVDSLSRGYQKKFK